MDGWTGGNNLYLCWDVCMVGNKLSVGLFLPKKAGETSHYSSNQAREVSSRKG